MPITESQTSKNMGTKHSKLQHKTREKEDLTDGGGMPIANAETRLRDVVCICCSRTAPRTALTKPTKNKCPPVGLDAVLA
jgi:hypothetical protein